MAVTMFGNALSSAAARLMIAPVLISDCGPAVVNGFTVIGVVVGALTLLSSDSQEGTVSGGDHPIEWAGPRESNGRATFGEGDEERKQRACGEGPESGEEDRRGGAKWPELSADGLQRVDFDRRVARRRARPANASSPPTVRNPEVESSRPPSVTVQAMPSPCAITPPPLPPAPPTPASHSPAV